MFKVENKQTALPLNESVNAKYADLLKVVVDQPVKEGVSLSEMSRDLKVINKLQDAEDFVEFTEEEFNLVKQKLALHRWPMRALELVEFGDYINSL